MPKSQLELAKAIDIEQFLSVQSHDLKTPFNHILGFTRLVLNGQDGPLSDFQREDLTNVYNGGMRGLVFMNGLVEMARINRGEKLLNLMEYEIQSLVEQGITEWQKLYPAKVVQFEYTTHLQRTLLRVDGNQMRQVIQSLLAYVVEFVDSPSKVTIQMEEEPGWVVTTIQSTGKKSRVTSQLDLDMHGFISRAYIERHHGELRTQVENDDGVTVSFALPR